MSLVSSTINFSIQIIQVNLYCKSQSEQFSPKFFDSCLKSDPVPCSRLNVKARFSRIELFRKSSIQQIVLLLLSWIHRLLILHHQYGATTRINFLLFDTPLKLTRSLRNTIAIAEILRLNSNCFQDRISIKRLSFNQWT